MCAWFKLVCAHKDRLDLLQSGGLLSKTAVHPEDTIFDYRIQDTVLRGAICEVLAYHP